MSKRPDCTSKNRYDLPVLRTSLKSLPVKGELHICRRMALLGLLFPRYIEREDRRSSRRPSSQAATTLHLTHLPRPPGPASIDKSVGGIRTPSACTGAAYQGDKREQREALPLSGVPDMEQGGGVSPWVSADDAAKVSLPAIVGLHHFGQDSSPSSL
jgi:hypothetical protein